jgi:PhnB protein
MLVPTFFFDGKCQEAIELYKKAFCAEVTRLEPYPEEQHKKGLVDAEIIIHGQKLWLTDEKGSPGMVAVFDTLEETMKAFEIMKEGGQVTHPPQKTKYSICECALKDRYGVIWGLMVKSFLEKP